MENGIAGEPERQENAAAAPQLVFGKPISSRILSRPGTNMNTVSDDELIKALHDLDTLRSGYLYSAEEFRG